MVLALLADAQVLLELAGVDQLFAAIVAAADPEVRGDVSLADPGARREPRRRGWGSRRVGYGVAVLGHLLGGDAVVPVVAAEEVTNRHDRVAPRSAHLHGQRSGVRARRWRTMRTCRAPSEPAPACHRANSRRPVWDVRSLQVRRGIRSTPNGPARRRFRAHAAGCHAIGAGRSTSRLSAARSSHRRRRTGFDVSRPTLIVSLPCGDSSGIMPPWDAPRLLPRMIFWSVCARWRQSVVLPWRRSFGKRLKRRCATIDRCRLTVLVGSHAALGWGIRAAQIYLDESATNPSCPSRGANPGRGPLYAHSTGEMLLDVPSRRLIAEATEPLVIPAPVLVEVD